MKKITAILFLSIYLFYTSALHELLKINSLIEHFYETQENDSAITFSKFLLMHYVTDDQNDRDNDQDQQLPFKSTNTHTSANTNFYISNLNIQPLAVRSFTLCKPVKTITKDLFVETDFNANVWHPPQNA